MERVKVRRLEHYLGPHKDKDAESWRWKYKKEEIDTPLTDEQRE